MKLFPFIRTAIIDGILGTVAWFGFGSYHFFHVTMPDAYAVWWVAGMVSDYMDDHDGAWPRNWDDLRQPYEKATQPSGKTWTFEELRARVDIDWNADPKVLATAEKRENAPPFKVIWLRDGSHAHWTGREPNEMVWENLQHRKVSSAQSRPTTEPAPAKDN